VLDTIMTLACRNLEREFLRHEEGIQEEGKVGQVASLPLGL
jgi:hypothetical protein